MMVVWCSGYTVTRRATPDERYRERREYRFQRPVAPESHPEVTPEVTPEAESRNPEDPKGDYQTFLER
jgi:hypothetical protein